MRSVPLVTAWFLFAIVNGICEEMYWHGFLLDETHHLPHYVGIASSALLFTAIHPIMLGVFSHIQAFDPARPFALLPFIAILAVLSVSYCLSYLNTRSLRWPAFSHILSDLGTLSIFGFMNMIVL